MKSFDCRLIEDGSSAVYQTIGQGDLSAIRVSGNHEEALFEDGTVDDDIRVEYVREMQYPHEQYIYGGQASSTKTYVCFSGTYSGREQLAQYSSSVNVRINKHTIVKGTSDSVTSEWEWEVVKTGDAVFVGEEEELTDLFNKDCICVGYKTGIDTVEIVRPVFESENGNWIE